MYLGGRVPLGSMPSNNIPSPQKKNANKNHVHRILNLFLVLKSKDSGVSEMFCLPIFIIQSLFVSTYAKTNNLHLFGL